MSDVRAPRAGQWRVLLWLVDDADLPCKRYISLPGPGRR